MVTVIAIFSIVAAVVLANLPAFRDEAQLQLTAQEIALVARQAQYYGRATRGFGGAGTDFPSYGLYFNLSSNPETDDKSFVFFGDKNDNSGYEEASGELLEKFIIGGTVKIKNIFSYTLPAATLDDLVVLFKRPELDANFFRANGIQLDTGNFSAAVIRLVSTRNPDSCRDLVIWNTGHIYTEKPSGGC